NFVGRKYDLSVQDICRLLDEDGIFGPDGDILLDEFQHKASLQFRQDKRRQEQRDVYAGKVISFRQAETEEEQAPLEHAVQMEY
ncbi:hypothetical protein Q8G40_29905, partial [Klebsiella pneumoniae]